MVSSTLNPQSITKNSAASLDSFGNFMTGGSLTFSSSVATAANKIVSFNRQEVSPIGSNINSLISNISTNILNQVDNSIKNTTKFLKNDGENKVNELRNDIYSKINELQSNLNTLQKDLQVKTQDVTTQIVQQQQTQPQTPVSGFQEVVNNIQVQITNVLDNTLKSFSKDYQEKIKGFDDARPNIVLSKFLDLYRNAIGFINFFGDRKNIRTIETNLKAIRKIFEESFEVASVLRQTIVKIVNQLSNLPTASPNSGGLNLDIDVPGGRLRQAGGPSVRNVSRAAKFGGISGAGLLGLGGAAAAVSGMGRAKEYQESLLSEGVSPVSGEQYIPENIVESFSAIVDRFVSAVNGLISGAKKSSGSGGGAAPGAAPGAASSSSGGGGGNLNAADIIADTAEEKAFIATVRETEGTAGSDGYNKFFGGSQYGGDLSTKTVNEVANLQKRFLAEGKGTFSGGRSAAVGAGQFMKPEEIVRAMGLDPSKEKFTPELQNKMILYLAKRKRGVDVSKPLSIEDIRILNEEWSGFGPRYGQTKRTLEQTKKIYEENLKEANVKGRVNLVGTAQVTSAPTQTQAIQSRAQAISQPAQQVPQTISLPPTVIDASGGGQQQGGGGIQTIPSQPPGPGPEVPFLPTTNPDNFLTMYSRIVYNIVDG